MACCDSDRRRCILEQLKCLVDNMGDCCPPPPRQSLCCPPPCPAGSCCPPIIEIYDPCPKPAIPLACPAPLSPLDPEIPVPHVACPTNPNGGFVIPIVSPQPVPCIPLTTDCGAAMEQPCVPCNPPAMMVCYRRGGCRPQRPPRRNVCADIVRTGGSGGGCCGAGTSFGGGGGMALKCCKSRELRASIMYYGCDCIKRNGLQDQCPRTGCQGDRLCAYDPPCCCPGQIATRKLEEQDERYDYMVAKARGGGANCHGSRTGGGGYGGSGGYSGGRAPAGCLKAEYLCFPAYFKMPPCSPNCCTPCSPFGGPNPCQPLSADSSGPCPSIGDCCPMPQCCPPVPTIPLPPCPPITVPAPPQVLSTPIPMPVPTPVFPMCPCPPQISPC